MTVKTSNTRLANSQPGTSRRAERDTADSSVSASHRRDRAEAGGGGGEVCGTPVARVWQPATPQTLPSPLRFDAAAPKPEAKAGRSALRLRAAVLPSILWTLLAPGAVARAETISIVLASNAAPRIEFGAEQLAEAFKAEGIEPAVSRESSNRRKGQPQILVGEAGQSGLVKLLKAARRDPGDVGRGKEGFVLATCRADITVVLGDDDTGALYGCLELARRIRAAGKLPDDLDFRDRPAMSLRGTCIGLQKTYILPGRKVYEYPYTPELFPWFYDKALWRQYLDFLVANRMNTLYLWNGHPFASLVRLQDYPDAVEVPPDVFAKNVEMFHWLTAECDRRGIWLVQMFYNILLPKPLAEKHGISTQLSAPTPLASDYTRKAIAAFVKQYPHVGLLVCLGEALRGTPNQIEWCTNVILPGVLDGMKAAGLKQQPPVVIRTHAMNAPAVMPEAFKVYTNLFTMTKYNGESLTTWEPRGRNQATQLAMARLGPHVVNVHILSNLEPFRYGDQQFIRKCVQAARDRLGAAGLHLYPLSYWNWPDSPDIANPPLKQWKRDWIWFVAWSRYAWNPDIPEPVDRAWWIGQLADHYGNTNAAALILDAYNHSGEVAPRLIRRFGITEGNRQTLSLGMTLDQLVNPGRYSVLPDLWESQSPPGERLQDYVKKEWNHEPHEGETPVSVINDALQDSARAVAEAAEAAPLVTKNRAEFDRLRNDMGCIQAMARFYAAKASAAMLVLRYNYSHDIADMQQAAQFLAESLEQYETLAKLTQSTYHFANSMQTSQRKIPFPGGVGGVPTNYLWSQLVPLYRKELVDFRKQIADLKNPQSAGSETGAPKEPWPAAKFSLLGTNAETYEVKVGARPFVDRQYTITGLAPELDGLTGIRFAHEAAKNGRYQPVEFEVTEPVQVLIGYFNDNRPIWLQVPNLDFAAQADERGGVDTILRNAAAIAGCPNVNVHAFRFEPGRHKLELIGKGSFVVLGVVPASTDLARRDAGIR